MSFFFFFFIVHKKNVEQAPPLNNLLPPQAFHFFISFFWLTTKKCRGAVCACAHTHTHENGTSLSRKPQVCVCRERQNLGRIVGHREVPLHRRWEVGCLVFSVFHLGDTFLSGGSNIPGEHTHTHTKGLREREMTRIPTERTKMNEKKGGGRLCIFFFLLCVFIESTYMHRVGISGIGAFFFFFNFLYFEI